MEIETSGIETRNRTVESEEIKQLAVAVVTSALNARALEGEDRITRYQSDFVFLTENMSGDDFYRMCSLLGDMAGSFVELIADIAMSEPEETMIHLAKSMLDTPTKEL